MCAAVQATAWCKLHRDRRSVSTNKSTITHGSIGDSTTGPGVEKLAYLFCTQPAGRSKGRAWSRGERVLESAQQQSGISTHFLPILAIMTGCGGSVPYVRSTGDHLSALSLSPLVVTGTELNRLFLPFLLADRLRNGVHASVWFGVVGAAPAEGEGRESSDLIGRERGGGRIAFSQREKTEI